MKVILVNGSPNKNGCTYTALCEVEKTLNQSGVETEIFWIGTKAVSGCIACKGCIENRKCVIDDVVNEFAEKAQSADGFVFGSPVHYAGLAGNMASFMDRVFYSSACGGNAKIFRYKPVSGIISARRGGATAAYDQFNKYFGITEMPIISTRYWNMVHGSNAEEVIKDEEGMQCMRMLGRNMAYYLKCIEAGKNAGIELPEREKIVMTNFIRKD